MSEEKIKILLVEDDKDDFLLFKTYLHKLPISYDLEWEQSYDAGIERLKQKSDFHLCFVDFHLGAKNGLEFIKEVKKHNLPQPIIMLTGQGDEQLGLRAVRTGAEDFYNKAGINAETLNRAIRFTLERRKARTQEQELLIAQREKRIFSTIFEKAPAFITILRGSNHVFEMANPSYYQLVGHRDIIGKPIKEAIPEIEGQGFIDMLDDVYTSGKPHIENEIKMRLKRTLDDFLEERYVNFVYQPIIEPNGTISGIFVHGLDVTEQVLSRVELQKSQERLKLAQKAGNVGTFEWLLEADQMIWTPELEALYGLPPGGFNGTYEEWESHVHAEDIEEVNDALNNSIKNGTQFQKEFRIILPEKGERWLLGKGDVYFGDNGKPIRMVGVNIDITERKALERQKDDFLGIASHELKTPVTSIKAYAQVLESIFRKKGDAKAADQLAKMDAQVDKLTNLIADLLDVTKIQSGRLLFHEEVFEYNVLVEEVVEEIQRTVNKHTIIKKLGKNTDILGDRERIGQVITNLITNAIKYSPSADKIIVESTVDKDMVTLRVQDFGVGIPKEKQERVFEQFFRVSGPKQDTFPGLGLGLYISSEIIKREGGKIWVESEEGKGSTFCFTLPIKKSTKSSS
jgi:signal transduction histidine kinase/CheY-like chemotaxis protein